jgi:hypothetical protein
MSNQLHLAAPEPGADAARLLSRRADWGRAGYSMSSGAARVGDRRAPHRARCVAWSFMIVLLEARPLVVVDVGAPQG